MKRTILFLLFFVCNLKLLAQKPELQLPLETGYSYLLTVGYGGEICPQLGGGIDQFHTGDNYHALDFDNPKNYPEPKILAASNGTVTVSTYGDCGGNYIIIDHGNGYTTGYMHLKSRNKNINDYVSQGEIIGIMGDTGECSQGSHLHFVLKKDGVSILPEPMSGYTNFKPGNYYYANSQPLPETADVGEFQYGSYPKITQAFIRCYNRHDVGTPFNNGYGPYVHDCGNSIWIQDYKRNDGGIRHILYNPIPPFGTNQTEAYMIFGGIAEYYFNHNGPYDFGVPFSDELTVTYYGGQNNNYGDKGDQKVIQKFHQKNNEGERKIIAWDNSRGAYRCQAGIFSYSDEPGATIYEWKNGQEEK